MAEAPPPDQPPRKPDDKQQPGQPPVQASHSEGEQTGRKRRRGGEGGEGGSQSDTAVFYFQLQAGKPVLQPGPSPASSDSSDSASSRTSIFRITLPANFPQAPAQEHPGPRPRSLSGSSLRELEGGEGAPSGQVSSGVSSATSEEEGIQRGSSERSLTPLSDEEASVRRFIYYTYREPLPRDQREFICMQSNPALPWRGDDVGNRSSPSQSSQSSDFSRGIPTRFRSTHGGYLSADSVESYLGDAASTSSGSVSAASPAPFPPRKPPDMPGYAGTTSESSSAGCLSDLPVDMPLLGSFLGGGDSPRAARSDHPQAQGLSERERVERMRCIYTERPGEELEAVGMVREAPVLRGLQRSRSATFPFVRWHTLSDTALQVVGPDDGMHGSPLRRNMRPRLDLLSSDDSEYGISTVSIL